MHRFLTLFVFATILASNCTLDEHMTCPLGFERRVEVLEVEVPSKDGTPRMEKREVEVCIEPYTMDTGSSDTDTDTDTDTDADTDTDGDSDQDGGPDASDTDSATVTGLGIKCDEFGENVEPCKDYEADFCALDPFSGNGYCTYQNCSGSSCPEEVKYCCDCSKLNPPSELIWGIACLRQNEAFLASQNGCTCTPGF